MKLCTDIGNNGLIDQIRIYPDPTKGELFIETGSEMEIRILNVLGQVFGRKKLNRGTNLIDLNELAPGLYYIDCEDTRPGTVVKVVRQ